jgi:hypothetical protein
LAGFGQKADPPKPATVAPPAVPEVEAPVHQPAAKKRTLDGTPDGDTIMGAAPSTAVGSDGAAAAPGIPSCG